MTENSILGRPITGDVSNYNYRKPVAQKGPEEFLAYIDEFFEQHPECTFIRWAQGTPGFNDGEPCTFDIHETRFGFVDPEEELDEDEKDDDYGDNALSTSALKSFIWDTPDGKYNYRSDYHYEYNKTFNGVLFTEEVVAQYENFGIGEEFEDLISEKFGDPAEITVTRDGFHVDYYEIGY
jgi:hypothetical protein